MKHVPKLQCATGDMEMRIRRLREAILDLVAPEILRGDWEGKNVATSAIAQAAAFGIVWCLHREDGMLERVDAHMTTAALMALLTEGLAVPNGMRPEEHANVIVPGPVHG